ncbi:MAG: acyl-CoA dehydrogenase family protein [Sinobacteraceae bacterium]|nr:acyl-CoA dehydrogenase family protein [Nevskiaceae bacterium]
MLGRLRQQLDAVTRVLAQTCTVAGALDAVRLDQEQLPSYDLALASAELLAAETALQQTAASAMPVERRLALTSAADAILVVVDKLQNIAANLDIDTAEINALAVGAEVQTLRRAVLSGKALDETGRAVIDCGGDVGHIALNEELTLAQEQFRRIARDLVAPLAEKIHRHDLIVPEDLLQPLREMGVFGLSIPERFGGSAPNDRDDNLMMIVVTEALSQASLAAAGSLITRPEILSRALLTGGTEEQKLRWLPQIAAGQPLCGIAITEPDYGSDVANLQLRGTRTEGGWLLNGAKTWCTFAGKAGLIMTVVRTAPDKSLGYKGLSVLLVEKPSYEGREFTYRQKGGGRLSGRAIPTIGYRGMHSFDLAFDNFFVPDANVIGGEAGLGKGFYFTMAGMVGGRLQTAARASGIMRAALLAAIAYAGDRKVFGAPLADYPLTRAKLARMAARYAACRRLTYATGKLVESGGGRTEASLVKLFACRSAEWVTREAMQIHGGMGYAEETPVSRYFVDARVLSIFEGAEETLALKVVARSQLEAALARKAA